MSDPSEKDRVRENVIRQVLKMNPALKAGRSTEEFAEELMGSARAAKAANTPANASDTRFLEVFQRMLGEFTKEYEERHRAIDAKRDELRLRSHALNEKYVKEVALFLQAAVGHNLTDAIKNELRANADLLKKLDINIAGLQKYLKDPKAPGGTST